MALNIKEIEQELISLPLTERARLADVLLSSMSDETSIEAEFAWAQECKSRMDAFDRGEMEAEDGQDVFSKLEARYNQ